MRCNWDGTMRAWRRWSVGLCCAAGIATGQQLLADEPAGSFWQQYLAAKNRVAVETPAEATDVARTDEAAANDAEDAAPAQRVAESASPTVPLIPARPILAPLAGRPPASRTAGNIERQEGAGLAPIVSPAQARQPQAALPPARNGLPTSTFAPVNSASKPFHSQASRGMPPRQTAPAGYSAPLRLGQNESDAPAAYDSVPQPKQASVPGPLLVHNPLLPPRRPLVQATKLSEAQLVIPAEKMKKAEKLAPIVRPDELQPAKLRPNPLPLETEAAAPVPNRPARLQGVTGTSIREAKPIPTLAEPEPLKSAARPERAVQPASAIEQLETASLQLEPAEEFGQLPEGSPFEAIGESGTIKLRVRRSLLMRTKVDVYRTATVDEAIVELVQFTPREISLIGRSQGQTHITFWFNDPDLPPVTYLVEVAPDAEAIKVQEEKYKLLENVINEMFPDSKVYLVLVADKLLVKGQARDSEEAAQIMTIIRAQANNIRGGLGGGYGGGLSEGLATPVLSLAATGNNPGPGYTVINMLRVPGVQQVALKVKIAELNRSAARGFGVDVAGAVDIGNNGDELIFASILNAIGGGGTSVIASLDGGDLDIGIRFLQQRGVIRLLSEPTLVTLSGRPATFIAGGEFAVPTIVGNVGLNAVTTDFRAFGAIISFVPTVVDKDRIRLQVAPEFSQINNQLAVGGTPGLNVRAATTTVEMREGQTLAIAGLLEDNYTGTSVGDLPFLSKIFGRRNASHNETELIILVTPELVQPMEPEEVPPLPGFDVTEPTGGEFFLGGNLEGNPTRDHRSTVWPRLKRRYGMGGPAMTSGPFGHGQ